MVSRKISTTGLLINESMEVVNMVDMVLVLNDF
jgi:hypothetical protein